MGPWEVAVMAMFASTLTAPAEEAIFTCPTASTLTFAAVEAKCTAEPLSCTAPDVACTTTSPACDAKATPEVPEIDTFSDCMRIAAAEVIVMSLVTAVMLTPVCPVTRSWEFVAPIARRSTLPSLASMRTAVVPVTEASPAACTWTLP